MDRLSTGAANPGRANELQQSYFTQLITIIKAKLIKLSQWLSLAGVSV